MIGADSSDRGSLSLDGQVRRRLVPAEGLTCWVAPEGSDADPGTFARPWRTIGKACAAAVPGSTVFIRGGTYAERVSVLVSGTPIAWITVAAYGDERVVLDGSSLTPPSGVSAMLSVEDRSYLRFDRLEIASYRTRVTDDVVAGVLIRGSSHHIELLRCAVHHIGSDAPVRDGRSGRNAHGIAVYGTNGAAAIHDLRIVDSEVAYCTLGSSEAVALNGNVEDFEIVGNRVHDNDNIGIDLIGWEGTASANDQARNGIIRGNHVWANSSAGNPAYTDLSAGGIYVDGGRDLVIEGNVTHHNDLGIEVGCENQGRTTTGVEVRDNFVYLNKVTGIGIGGYDSERGVVQSCTIRHNTLFHNDTKRTGTGEIMLQVGHDNALTHNVVVCSDQGIAMTNPFSASLAHGNTLAYNLYFAPGGASAISLAWQNQEYGSFDAYRAASGQDGSSLFADPMLADVAAPDLHLRPGSPAIDAGDPAFVPAAGERDIDGEPRLQGLRVDIGAHEMDTAVAPTCIHDQGLADAAHFVKLDKGLGTQAGSSFADRRR